MVEATPTLWLADAPLLLASGSATRRILLAAAGLPVDVERADIDERGLEGDMGAAASPAAIAERLASEKARVVAERHPGRVVIGADQVLDFDGRPMAKPADHATALRQIGQLAGRTHRLHSAVAIRAPGHPAIVFVEQASLTLRRLDETAIAAYVDRAGAAVLTSAGGYQIEGLGIHLFERIEGEHTTILGLPMLPLLAVLRRLALVGS